MSKGIGQHLLGEQFEGYLLVKEMTKGTTTTQKPFLTVTLGDATGTITSKVWNATAEKEELYASGTVMKVEGLVEDYLGNPQLKLMKTRKTDEQDEVELSSLLETAPISGDKIYAAIEKEVQKFENAKIRDLTQAIFNKYQKDFEVYPAAKSNHHAYVSGLAYHTYSMMRVAISMSKLYPFLNRELLLAGVILHDIGKIIEYSGYISTEVTLEGRLKGHISIMNEEIGIIAKELGIEGEEVLLLQHMVLSHHGKGEWGSPVKPLIIEANVLHQIDMFDASLEMYKNAAKDTEKGGFTNRVYGLDNRSFYKPTI